MKNIKYIIIVFIVLLLSGCKMKTIKEEKENKVEDIVEEKEEYIDDNKTLVGIYKEENNKLVLINEFENTATAGTDIGIFQVLNANLEKLELNKNFGELFYDYWSNDLKQGFNIKYELNDGTKIDNIILEPQDCNKNLEYIICYLYDDYNNLGKSFYSHIEEKENNTLYTSIKLYANGYFDQVKGNIELTYFTYDSDDDIVDNKYIGNSKFTLNILNS